jgi:hypothetical protein
MNTTRIHPETGRIMLPKSKRPLPRALRYASAALVTDGRLAFALRWRDHFRRKSESRRAHKELTESVQLVKDVVGALILTALGYVALHLAFAL